MLCNRCQNPDLRWYEDIQEAPDYAEISENIVFENKNSFQERKFYIHHPSFGQLACSKDAGCHICAAIWYAFRTPIKPSYDKQDAIDSRTAGDELTSNSPTVEDTVALGAISTAGRSYPVVWSVYASRQPKYADDSWKNFHEWITVFCGQYERKLWREATPTGPYLQISHRLEELWKDKMLLDVDSSTRSENTLELAKLWYDDCRSTHDVCSLGDTPDTSTPLLPTRLIDVKTSEENPVLYEPSSGTVGNWVALSHCWGDTKPVAVGDQNEKAYTEAKVTPRELKLSPLSEWPQTFQDAVDITRKFKLRYLWIDNFCIKQQNKDDWIRESQRMTKYFGNATFTIAASWAASDDDGLYHSRNPLLTSPLRLIDASTDPPYEGYYVSLRGLNGYDIHEIAESPLYTRAWVLQEQMLSRRILRFCKGGVYWQCFCSEATPFYPSGNKVERYQSEGFGEGRQCRLHIKPVNPTGAGRSPYHDLWYSIVREFTDRNMKMKSDVLPAVSGLAQALRPFMSPEDSYVAGLWSGDLTLGLLWIVDRQNTREHGPPPPGAVNYDPRGFSGPSWSWMSQCDRRIWHSFHRKILPGGHWPYDKNSVGTNVCEILVQHKTKDEIYGEVEGGSLRIKAKLPKICVEAKPYELTSDDEQQRSMITNSRSKSHVHLLKMDTNPLSERMLEIFRERTSNIFEGECDVDDPDSDLWRSHVTEGQVEAIFLPLIMYENDYKGARIAGLAILPTKRHQDEYVRIGRVGVEIGSCYRWKYFGLPTQEIILV